MSSTFFEEKFDLALLEDFQSACECVTLTFSHEAVPYFKLTVYCQTFWKHWKYISQRISTNLKTCSQEWNACGFYELQNRSILTQELHLSWRVQGTGTEHLRAAPCWSPVGLRSKQWRCTTAVLALLYWKVLNCVWAAGLETVRVGVRTVCLCLLGTYWKFKPCKKTK